MLKERLKTLISSLSIKKGVFAEKIGFSQSYVSMILNGKRETPTDRFFESVAREFSVNILWLRDGDGNMFESKHTDILPSDEMLLRKYWSLPLSERKIIDEIIDALIIKNTFNNQNDQ